MILLLDSEPLTREVLKEVLENAGHVVLATGSLGVAVKEFARCQVDLLVTHPYVNNIPGHEAAKYLRTKCRQKLPVLIVAGLLKDDRLQYRAAQEGFDIFPPPFTAPQLIEKVDQILNAPAGATATTVSGAA
jgi:CheY-like chemotaxis protein